MPIKAPTQQATEQALKAGTVLFRHSEFPRNAVRLLEGTVALGWMEGGEMQQHLGLVQGPCWLDLPPLILGSHDTPWMPRHKARPGSATGRCPGCTRN